jgi:hypothetical protein
MLTDVSKERLIQGVQYLDGIDDQSDFVRLDFVAPNCIPLVISCKQVVPSDSLGLLSITLSKESLEPLMDLIHSANSKVNSRRVDYILLRVTYRHNGEIFQYYQTNETIITAYLRSIFEKHLRKVTDSVALSAFYEFVRPARLDNFKKPLRD